ncbi:MAG: alpha/beta fold hydrolase, partial [Candidatus Hodarchaeota archaeon]
ALTKMEDNSQRLSRLELQSDYLAPRDREQDSSYVAPRNQVEQTIADIWQKLLGMDQIGIHDNFFDLGGHSLIAIQLFARIEKIFGKKLPLATLFNAPTIDQLASLLQEDYLPSWRSLVKIQSGGSRPPFFCVHAEGGNVLEYRYLAKHLGQDQPFYGLQAQGLDGNEINTPVIEDMAGHYIKEIRTIQPNGSYYIGGYCLGGLVAFEMAQQLVAEGERVAFLALISTSTPDQLTKTLPFFQRLIYRFVERIGLEVSNISVLDPKAKISYMEDRIRRFTTLLQVRAEGLIDLLFSRFGLNDSWHSMAFTLQTLIDATNRAYLAYVPKVYPGRLFLFRVSKPGRVFFRDPFLGWKGLADGRIRDYEVFGYHRNILKEPNVRGLAEKLRACLEEAQAGNAG